VIVPLAASARGSHLHRFDDHEVVAIGNGSSHCTDASRHFGDDLYLWHANSFLLSAQNA
jgi:hypothetical protein